MHEQLLDLTFYLPCKTIAINDEDYLQRYYLGEQLGFQYWLHRFLRNDSEHHLHSHPWSATSTILCGSYTEQRTTGKIRYTAGQKNMIEPDTLHRIVSAEPNTWTLMQVSPARLPEWFFINDAGEKTFVKTSPTDWHTEHATRNNKKPYPNGALINLAKLFFQAEIQRNAA